MTILSFLVKNQNVRVCVHKKLLSWCHLLSHFWILIFSWWHHNKKLVQESQYKMPTKNLNFGMASSTNQLLRFNLIANQKRVSVFCGKHFLFRFDRKNTNSYIFVLWIGMRGLSQVSERFWSRFNCWQKIWLEYKLRHPFFPFAWMDLIHSWFICLQIWPGKFFRWRFEV